MTKSVTDVDGSLPSVGSMPSVVSSDDEVADPSTNVSFPVVGIGASAGGMDAVTQLLRALPNDTGLSFVVIQHLG